MLYFITVLLTKDGLCWASFKETHARAMVCMTAPKKIASHLLMVCPDLALHPCNQKVQQGHHWAEIMIYSTSCKQQINAPGNHKTEPRKAHCLYIISGLWLIISYACSPFFPSLSPGLECPHGSFSNLASPRSSDATTDADTTKAHKA